MINITKLSYTKVIVASTGLLLNLACDSGSSGSEDSVAAAAIEETVSVSESSAVTAKAENVEHNGVIEESEPSEVSSVLGLVEGAAVQAEDGEKRTGTGAAAYILPYVVGNGERKTNINLSNISTADITVHVAYVNLPYLESGGRHKHRQKCDECNFLVKLSGWDVVGLEFKDGVFKLTDESKWYHYEKDREYRSCVADDKLEYAQGFVILTVEEGEHLLEETSSKNVLLAEVSIEDNSGYKPQVGSYRPYAGRAIHGAQDEDLRRLSWGSEYVSLPMYSGGSIRSKVIGGYGPVENRIIAVNPYFEAGAIDPNKSKIDVSLFDHDEGGLSSKSVHYTCGVRFKLSDLIPEVAPGEIGADNSGTRVLFQVGNTTELSDGTTLKGGALCVIEERIGDNFAFRSCHESAAAADPGDTVLKDAKGDDWE